MARLLAGEERAGAAEADGDFIGDQVDAVLRAQAPRLFKIGRMVHAHAARALHQRLQDERAGFVMVPGDNRLQLGGAAQRALDIGFVRVFSK